QDPADRRIVYFNSFLPEQRIASFSHLSIHVAPSNGHYGVNGTYRDCGINSGGRPEDDVARCLSAPLPWRGETFIDHPIDPADQAAMARLTFNPRFDDLLNQIDAFLMRLHSDAHPGPALSGSG
ncbi:MAG: hypothetical protein AAF637_14850, partial [Pseudomonadota bacterium]